MTCGSKGSLAPRLCARLNSHLDCHTFDAIIRRELTAQTYCTSWVSKLSCTASSVNSWLWVIFTMLSRELDTKQQVLWNTLEQVRFHACCHGSSRRKHTEWRSTPGVYSAVTATCDNTHQHEPWRVQWSGTSWSFNTSLEADFPVLLSQRAAACMVWVAIDKGHGVQSKRHLPLIPEYHHIASVKPGAPIPQKAKLFCLQVSWPRRRTRMVYIQRNTSRRSTPQSNSSAW